ncbi:MAG: NTP transferase domain-containing protein [Candidatus Cloacimonetes bacterium]|jgi:bifunctional UDP-N-acetylglucosamine pyrophosphorylase / glucosamine-1-phosphate N-acetyltransferase|nr:NTP transferase domain-containing protein [Candidatus Cloacimonadota bacterium]MBT6994942.1 NTP transferase domain-containing protein [Candidatus Cloacimonadota bacterium]MBT7469527.1 NTP transferase domain-containing protein [Candidatus Cloacimonadota bacterium]
MKKTASIILAAGKGTRMQSEKPKVIHQLAQKAMITRVIETAQKVNSELIATVVGYKKEEVIAIIPQNDKIKFIEQKEQNGTGHAVMVTENTFKNFDGNIFILCGDVPLLRHQTLEKILAHHLAENAVCTVLTAVMDDALKYGRIVRNETGNVLKIVEFKDATDSQKEIKEINTGIYCFDSKSLFDALSQITNKNNQNEYYLTDTLEILNNENKLVTSVLLDDMIEAAGVNSKEQLAELETEYFKRQQHFDE